MATLLLAAAGSAVGGAIGGSVLGVSSALIGQAIGASIGQVIDARLTAGNGGTIKQEGPRLESLDVMTSQEGAPLHYIAGRTAIAGEVIWAARLREVVSTDTEKVGGGKGGSQKVETTSYSYFASFAVSLGEGPIAHMGRIWLDGRVADIGDLINAGKVRFYPGDETQGPDPLIQAIEGAAPGYRGTSYVVFEDLPLEDFGNRIPQVKVEVFAQPQHMEHMIPGVCMIPGSTEWGYLPEPNPRIEVDGFGEVVRETPENAARYAQIADWKLSVDMMDALLPVCETVSLVAAWFGTDQRAGFCRIEPRVEFRAKRNKIDWRVGGLGRDDVNEVSTDPDGRPAFGSTPADLALVRGIKDLKARGKRVVLYPFVLMDIKADQALPHPSGTGTQADYPWRGRIVPAAGASVAAEVAAFLGVAAAADFSTSGEAVTYSGDPDDFGFRRMILHLAHVAQAAGGVDAFLIGSEMRGLTMARHTDGSYPFVDGLRALAAEVRSVLPSAKISYAADWSEYHSDRAGAEIRFHLDPLWADANIDFVGIDNYMPLSDWRHVESHDDRDDATGLTSPYNLDYLKSQIEGGEYWDYYYASEADRLAQIRTPIADQGYGEPWVYRQKAIRDWQANAHHERDTSGTRAASPTAWVPGSKPVWLTELGCPAVDLGSNQPNLFTARLSSESALPYHSAGIRDDFISRQFLRAHLEWWAVHGGAIVDVANIQVWCWDCRPWPEFPNRRDLWTDGADWRLGHWLNGRAGSAPAAEWIEKRFTEVDGLPAARIDVAKCYGQADGYAAAAPISFRDYVQPFEFAFGLNLREEGGVLHVVTAAAEPEVASVDPAGMVESDTAGRAPYVATRGALEDAAGIAIFRFRDGVKDYQATAVRDEIDSGPETGSAEAETALILDFDRGAAVATRILRNAQGGRETLSFAVPRSATHVRPGVILPVVLDDQPARRVEVVSVTDGALRQVEARSFNRPDAAPAGQSRGTAPAGTEIPATVALGVFLDLPILTAGRDEWDGALAFHAAPWPGGVTVARAYSETEGYAAILSAAAPATIGETVAALPAGTPWTWSPGPLDVKLYRGSLVSRPDLEVLGGANRLAVRHADGWEVLQFRGAELIGESTYRLTGLLRGQRGTEALAAAPLPAPARVVLLNAAVLDAGLAEAEVGLPLWYRYGPAAIPVTDHLRKQHAFSAVGRRPFAPVHLSAAWSGGDATLSWHRRSRLLTGTWPASGQDPALGETAESYRIEVGPVGAPLRVETAATPAWTYTAAMRAADGAALPVEIRVAQLSETYGPGTPAALTLKG